MLHNWWRGRLPAKPPSVLDYVDVTRMIAAHTEPVTKSVMTTPLSTGDLTSNVEAGFKTCEGSESKDPAAPRMRLLGYEVVRVLTEMKNATSESWVAPALDCYPLQDVFRRNDGHRQDVTATAVEEGEPPAWMFQTPLDYVERSPKQIQTQYAPLRRLK